MSENSTLPEAVNVPADLPLPAEAHAALQSSWKTFLDCVEPGESVHPSIISSVARVWPFSAFVCRNSLLYPSLLLDREAADHFGGTTGLERYRNSLCRQLSGCVNENDVMAELRRFRRREMLRIAWRDLAGWADVQTTLRETSELAEAVLSVALEWLFKQACAASRFPVGESGEPQPLCIIAMGKLGAWELNFSSDIDLIFVYGRDGVLDDRRATSYSEFYTRLARRLIQALDQKTEDGFVFRVDMRLRPFGDSGPLVISTDALELYLQTQAREWERYALVKARVLSGDVATRLAIDTLITSFVYRRYLDYRAFGDLRDLKAKINAEVERRDRLDNIKLGPGGIREIEFIVQAFQLIRGGCDATLRDRSLSVTLAQLGRGGHLPAAIVTALKDAYFFLRRVENRLQEYDDRQTHELPADPLRRTLLALSLGFPDWEAFKSRLDEIRRHTHEVFEQVMAAPHTEEGGEGYTPGREAPPEEWLESAGFRDPVKIRGRLDAFGACRAVKRLTARGASDLGRVMPLILRAVAGSAHPEIALDRVLGLIESLATRSVYFALLAENPLAISQLVKFATASPWLIHYITRFPVLLDELLDPRALYRPLVRAELVAELNEKLGKIDSGDVEQLMSALRHFKQANVLRVAATDVMGVTPIMVVSDYLSYVAEALVASVLGQAWRITATRHGEPPGGVGSAGVRDFGIVAYGKLGGLELGYGSDLDLVFLHSASDVTALTTGASPLTLAEFYARVAKKMVALMTTQTHAGALYEIDLRLRPSGSSGLLVSSVEAYEAYQMDSAWTWEQQSLVRARYIAGDPTVAERFTSIRHRSLTRRRTLSTLRSEVIEMRDKMRQHLDSSTGDSFDLKQGRGGIADIEFLVQFGVLASASSHPEVTRWTDVVRLLDDLRDVGFLTAQDADILRRSYCEYRAQVHRLALQEQPAIVPSEEYAEARNAVCRIWQQIMPN